MMTFGEASTGAPSTTSNKTQNKHTCTAQQ
jgi:hypothetical protein